MIKLLYAVVNISISIFSWSGDGKNAILFHSFIKILLRRKTQSGVSFRIWSTQRYPNFTAAFEKNNENGESRSQVV